MSIRHNQFYKMIPGLSVYFPHQAQLVPSDDITVFYQVSPSTDRLSDIIKSHDQYIYATIKQNMFRFPVAAGEEITRETFQVRVI